MKFRCWLNALYQFSLSQSLLCIPHGKEGGGMEEEGQQEERREEDSMSSTTILIPALSKAAAIVYNAMMLVKVCDSVLYIRMGLANSSY